MKINATKIIRTGFVLYWILLTVLLMVYNPFAVVPMDEEFVEGGFGIGMDAHVLTFILLTILGMASRFRRAWMWVLIFVLYAGVTEYFQDYTGRCSDWADFFNNLLGIGFGLIGWLVTIKLHGLFRRKTNAE